MDNLLRFFNLNSGRSKRKFKLDSIEGTFSNEKNGVRLITDHENWFIPNQTIDETEVVIEKNFKIVKEYYQDKVGTIITSEDLDDVCFKIVLHYCQMYNHWRTMYKREANRDLTFIQKDFADSYTTNIIIGYFKGMYPSDYEEKCMTMLNMTNAELREAVLRKEQYDNM